MAENLLTGRNIIVTGGTQGIGRGIAEYLAEQDAAGITTCGRNEKNGRAVAAAISESGCPCDYVRADLTEEADCRAVVKRAIDRFGTIHGLVNAAGLTDRGSLLDGSVELWNRLMNVNARAPFILMQDVARHMKAEGIHGSIVNIISDNYHGGHSFITVYAASKGAVATLTKNAAHVLLNDRIRVNGIAIGWTYTPHEHQIQLEDGQPENWLEQAEAEQPFKRLIRPQDVAYLTAYLLSDRAEMMTGSLIDFDQKVVGCFK